jgi:hypothetical protein
MQVRGPCNTQSAKHKALPLHRRQKEEGRRKAQSTWRVASALPLAPYPIAYRPYRPYLLSALQLPRRALHAHWPLARSFCFYCSCHSASIYCSQHAASTSTSAATLLLSILHVQPARCFYGSCHAASTAASMLLLRQLSRCFYCSCCAVSSSASPAPTATLARLFPIASTKPLQAASCLACNPVQTYI